LCFFSPTISLPFFFPDVRLISGTPRRLIMRDCNRLLFLSSQKIFLLRAVVEKKKALEGLVPSRLPSFSLFFFRIRNGNPRWQNSTLWVPLFSAYRWEQSLDLMDQFSRSLFALDLEDDWDFWRSSGKKSFFNPFFPLSK